MQKKETVDRKWYVIDATDMTLGRLATKVATILKGKHKPTYTPHVDCGDYVIVINAEKVALTGRKASDKVYYHHSNHPGGLKARTAGDYRANDPEKLIALSVKGMLPKGSLGRKQAKKLHVYRGAEHNHAAQQPEVLDITNLIQEDTELAQVQYSGTGRRKNSVARVRLVPGTGKIVMNGKPAEEYIPFANLREVMVQPFAVTETKGAYDVLVNVNGGGFSGQAGATRHGIARALLEVDPDFRGVLKRAGLLTRDARMKERKKPGLKKARKASQFSKR